MLAFGIIMFTSIAILGGVAVYWAVKQQKKLLQDFANDPEYTAVKRGAGMWPTIKTKGGALPAELDFDSVDYADHRASSQTGTARVLVWRARVAAVGLSAKAQLQLDKLGITGGHAAGAVIDGAWNTGDAAYDGLFALRGGPENVVRRVLADPGVRNAVQALLPRVRVIKLEPDDRLFVELQSEGTDAKDARTAMALARALGQAIHDAAGRQV
jgi:hypothetical protein